MNPWDISFPNTDPVPQPPVDSIKGEVRNLQTRSDVLRKSASKDWADAFDHRKKAHEAQLASFNIEVALQLSPRLAGYPSDPAAAFLNDMARTKKFEASSQNSDAAKYERDATSEEALANAFGMEAQRLEKIEQKEQRKGEKNKTQTQLWVIKSKGWPFKYVLS